MLNLIFLTKKHENNRFESRGVCARACLLMLGSQYCEPEGYMRAVQLNGALVGVSSALRPLSSFCVFMKEYFIKTLDSSSK